MELHEGMKSLSNNRHNIFQNYLHERFSENFYINIEAKMEEKTFKNVIEVRVNSNYFVILSINLNLRSESEHAWGVDQVR